MSATEEYLLKTRTARYRPVMTGGAPALWNARQNGFSLSQVEPMREDAQVSLCLRYRGTPLSAARFKIEATDPRVKKFVEKQFKRFWTTCLPTALEAHPYGYSAAEVLYRRRGGMMQLDCLKRINPLDGEIWTRKGKRWLVRISSALGAGRSAESTVGGPVDDLPTARRGLPAKGWWWCHNPVYDPWYGRSVLASAWLPWRLKTMPAGGGMDALAKWFYRHAYRGYVVRYPDTVHQDSADGTVIDAQSLARQMMDSLKSGSDVALSCAKGADGEYLWTIESYGEVNGNATDMISYIRDFLDVQIQRGIGIPDGIVTDGASQGYAGRKIPEDAYYTGCEEDLNALTELFDDEVCRPLVMLNFGRKQARYTVEPEPLVPIRQQAAQGAGGPLAGLLGGAGDQQQQGQDGNPEQQGGVEGESGDTGPGGTSQLSLGRLARRLVLRLRDRPERLSRGRAPRGPVGHPWYEAVVQAADLNTRLADRIVDAFPEPPRPAGRRRFAATKSVDPWQPYTGTRGERKGQKGWKHAGSGRVVWGNKPTGRGEQAAGKAPAKKAPAKPAAAKGKQAKADPELTRKRIEALRSVGAVGPEAVESLAKELSGLTVAQLGTLKKQLQLKASGNKAQLARKLAEQALSKQPEAKPTPTPPSQTDDDEISLDEPEESKAKSPSAGLFAPDDQPRTKDAARIAIARQATEAAGLTDRQREALINYTDTGYASMNAVLRGSRFPDPAQQARAERRIREIESALDKAILPEPVTVHRALKLDPARTEELLAGFRKSMDSGSPVKLSGFQSTTLDPDYAATFGKGSGVLMEIAAKKGLYLEGFTENPGEEEMLLPSGLDYRVAGVKELTIGGKTRTVIQLEQLT